MKKNQIMKVALVAGLLVVGNNVTYAQFGKLKNMAKKAVKEKVDDTKNSAVNEAKNQASDATGVNMGGDAPDASNVVWRWKGKESELGDWGELITFNGDRKSTAYMQQVKLHMDIFNKVFARVGSTEAYGLTDYITYGPDKKTAFPVDEIPRYAWTKAFVDNPTLDYFKVFAMALLYDTPTYMTYLHYSMNNATSGVVNTNKGWMLAWPSETAMISERRNREEYAVEIAQKKIALKDICEYTLMQYQRAEAALEKGSASLAHGYFMAEAIKTRVIEGHSQYNASDEMVRKVEAESAKWQANQGEMYRRMINLCSTSAMAPVDVPAGVSVAADIKSNGDAAAKKWAATAKLEYVKTIYLDSKWHTFKNPKYPYNITHYSVPCAVIVKQGDKYMMQKMDLQKTVNGQYGVVQGLGAKLQPVNYK
jgi:hypothetical protein